METPEWLNTIGRFAANTGTILANIPLGGALPLPYPMPNGRGETLKAIANSLVPQSVNDEERATRLEQLRVSDPRLWPALVKNFRESDQRASDIWAKPEAQALYREGGANAWRIRYPDTPLPPSQKFSLSDYPPLDDLDAAIAKAGGTDTVPLPFPIQAHGAPQFPPVAPKDQLDYENAQNALGYIRGGDREARTYAKVGLTPAQQAEDAYATSYATSAGKEPFTVAAEQRALAQRFPQAVLPGGGVSPAFPGTEQAASDVNIAEARAKAAIPGPTELKAEAENTALAVRLKNLRTTFLEAQNEHLGGALGGLVEAITGGKATGPMANLVKVPLAKYTDLGTDAQRKLIREQAAVENEVVHQLTGAQVSFQEALRLARQIPRMADDPNFFLTGIDTAVAQLSTSLSAAKQARAGAGAPPLTEQEAREAVALARDQPYEALAASVPQATPGPANGRAMKLKDGTVITVTD